jgi:hypothetical protein
VASGHEPIDDAEPAALGPSGAFEVVAGEWLATLALYVGQGERVIPIALDPGRSDLRVGDEAGAIGKFERKRLLDGRIRCRGVRTHLLSTLADAHAPFAKKSCKNGQMLANLHIS